MPESVLSLLSYNALLLSLGNSLEPFLLSLSIGGSLTTCNLILLYSSLIIYHTGLR